MINLNPFAISGLLIVIAYFPLFIFIILNGKTKLAQIYALHILSAGLWGLGALLIGLNFQSIHSTELLWKIFLIPVYFVPVFFVHAVSLIVSNQKSTLVLFSYLQAIFFSLATLCGLTHYPLEFMFNEFYWAKGNTLYLAAYIIWLILCTIAHLQLMIYYKKCYPHQKKQIFFLILAITGFAGGATNFFPTFGINFYPYGNFVIPVHSLCVSYAILKYQLLDIEVAIKKSLVYSILLAFISIFYLIAVFIFERLVQGYLGYKSLLFSILTAFIIGLICIPLRNYIQDIIDRLFFQKSTAQIAEENKRLLKEVEQTEKLRTIATLASGVAHEIKNPLTAINTFTEELPKKMNDPEFLQKFSKIVGKEVARINEMVHELLDFARPSTPQLHDTNVQKLIDDILEVLSNSFIKHAITVKTEYQIPSNFTMKIDPKQIKQALVNICLNAIESMSVGGDLTISVEQIGAGLRLSIKDTGPGIPSKDLPHIFDPFFTTKDHGTGLGLSVTHGIIQQHGGKIKVESSVGNGTTFILELPS